VTSQIVIEHCIVSRLE